MEDIHRQRVEHLCQELESGRFSQAQNALRCDDRYCCLGVACDLHDSEPWKEVSAPDRGRGDYFEYLGASGYLPREVGDWYGWVDYDNPVVIDEEGERRTLSQLNDLFHSDFCTIAAAIRRTYLDEDGAVNDDRE